MANVTDDNTAAPDIGSKDSPTRPISHTGRCKTVRFEVSDEECDNDEPQIDGDYNAAGHPPVSPIASTSAWASFPSASPLKLKVTMSFMKAYKAMRGPRDIEPSPLFSCLQAPRDREGTSFGVQAERDPFRLAGRDEIRLLNDVNDAIVGEGDDNRRKTLKRPFVRDSIEDEDAERKALFYFEQPAVTPIHLRGGSSSQCENDDEEDEYTISDHPLDDTKMDQGWLKANGPSEFDDEDPYVSDDDGGPSEVRISPAMFRALASGCTLDDVDSLRRVLPETPTMRPVTPHDKIMDVSKDTIRCNNVMPYCHRRQFDIHTGEELSPAYRIDQGPPSSVLWSPPGVTPERAGLYLLLLQEGQGEQQHPVRGSGMASLFQRMAPLDCNKLRTHLYGGLQGDEEEQSGNSSLSSTSFSSSSWVSSASLDSVANDKNDGHEERRRTMTFTWSEVNEAVRNCHFDAATTSLKEVNIGTRSLTRIGTETLRVRANAVATERALLQTFRNSWHTIQSGQVADASLVAANEEAQAAITAQARCLSVVEHQVELCRKAELARECQEAQEHYREQCRIEKQEKRRAARESRQARNQVRRRRRIVRNINESLRSLRTTVGESEARLARGRELQTVLIQRLKDGEARLERLCQDHGVSDVAALSEVLAARMAQLGVEEEE